MCLSSFKNDKTTAGRILRLAHHYDVAPTCGKLHKFFDELDEAAGITTEWEDNHCCRSNGGSQWTCAGNHNSRRYISARLALHEQHLENNRRWDAMDEHPEKHFFWLGREAA